jgi:nitrogenase molybdenum-iron protein alpha/beta subunit
MNDIKHLKCLSAVRSMTAVRQLTPAAFPGVHCPMHTALALASKIRGVSTLLIGTAECGYYSRNVPLSSPYGEEALHWNYVLDSKEVVFGFRKGLMEAIREMDKAGARLILLLSTCVPELIGLDMESICHEMQTEVKAMLIHLPLGNFKCGGYEPGYWKTLLAMGKTIEKSGSKGMTVNVLGRSALEEHVPMPHLIALLERQDVPLRFLAPDSSLDDFISSGDARLNLVLSPFMEPLAQWMAKEHDIPFASLHDVYNVREIENTYSQIGQHLGLEMVRKNLSSPDGFFWRKTLFNPYRRNRYCHGRYQPADMCGGVGIRNPGYKNDFPAALLRAGGNWNRLKSPGPGAVAPIPGYTSDSSDCRWI